jgi:hypothetical protein
LSEDFREIKVGWGRTGIEFDEIKPLYFLPVSKPIAEKQGLFASENQCNPSDQ